MREPKEFFSKVQKTRPYMIIDIDNYSTSEAIYLTKEEYKILKDYCEDNNVQIYPYEDKTLSRECVEEIWKKALIFKEELDGEGSLEY